MSETPDLCRDIQMKLPDALWALDEWSRYRSGKFCRDFATFEPEGEARRTYLFAVLEVPLPEEADVFTWGIWAEVSPEDHNLYLDRIQTPDAEGLVFEGRIANEIPGAEDALGSRVRVRCFADRRPAAEALEGSILEAQRKGLTLAEHEALDRLLFGDDEEEDEDEVEA